MRMADAAAIIGNVFAKVLLTRKPTNERNMSVSVPLLLIGVRAGKF